MIHQICLSKKVGWRNPACDDAVIGLKHFVTSYFPCLCISKFTACLASYSELYLVLSLLCAFQLQPASLTSALYEQLVLNVTGAEQEPAEQGRQLDREDCSMATGSDSEWRSPRETAALLSVTLTPQTRDEVS